MSCSWPSIYNRLPACCQSDCCRPVHSFKRNQKLTISPKADRRMNQSMADDSPRVYINPNAAPKILDLSDVRETDSRRSPVVLNKRRCDELADKAFGNTSSHAIVHIRSLTSQLPSPSHKTAASTDLVSFNAMVREGPRTASMDER